MSDNKHNGYTNYETWLAALWLDNDRSTNEVMREHAERLVSEMEDVFDAEEERGVTSLMGDFIYELVESVTPNAERSPSLFTDLLQSALAKIDYYDIAESQMADALRDAREPKKEAV